MLASISEEAALEDMKKTMQIAVHCEWHLKGDSAQAVVERGRCCSAYENLKAQANDLTI
jgi:hypothetical protein